MLELDGSMGEGGGQVLRTALGLALVTGTPLRIVNVRAKREKPGLRAQHCAAVAAAARVGAARVSGNEIGSRVLEFEPSEAHAGRYEFRIGTAGSAMLVFQTILPALLSVDKPSSVVIDGGTHNPLAPSFDFIAECFLPVLGLMGADVSARLERYGFYPKGGGRVVFEIRPRAPLGALSLLERGSPLTLRARAIVANLPRHIAQRELDVLAKRLELSPEASELVETRAAYGPGNAVIVSITSATARELTQSLGRRGLPAERVAEEAAESAAEYMAADVPVGRHLADQLLVPLALARSGSFRTFAPTLHATTNARVIEKLTGVCIRFEPEPSGSYLVEVV